MRFDEKEAEIFDDRAGLSDAVVEDVVKNIGEIVQPTSLTSLLEVGTGTGQIGRHLVKLPLRYVGFDFSNPMLEIFRTRIDASEKNYEIMQADGDKKWPVKDGSIDAIFSSRVLHLLNTEHVADELFRVSASTGAFLMIGIVHRDKDAPKNQMREKMRQLLADENKTSRDWKKRNANLFNICRSRGAEVLKTRIASSWKTSYNPIQSIQSWENKEGLAGTDVSGGAKKKVLEDLRDWANENFEDVYRTIEFDESYHLHLIKLPGTDEHS